MARSSPDISGPHYFPPLGLSSDSIQPMRQRQPFHASGTISKPVTGCGPHILSCVSATSTQQMLRVTEQIILITTVILSLNVQGLGIEVSVLSLQPCQELAESLGGRFLEEG